MEQYFSIKVQYPDTILLFQVGDFYELFFDDALCAAPILGIALTQRGVHKEKPIPLCGVPIHAINHYLSRLIKAGLHVAIADQLEDARPGTVVKRGVTRVLTPATLTERSLLDDKRVSYLCSLFCTKTHGGFVVLEVLTGHLSATTLDLQDTRALDAQLERFMPDEVIVDGPHAQEWREWLIKNGFALSSPAQADQAQQPAWIDNILTSHPLAHNHASVLYHALQQLYWYLHKNQPRALTYCKKLNVYNSADFLILDSATMRNLELVRNMQDGGTKNTLFEILDQAHTAMGSRLIKKWIVSPLINAQLINQRLESVQILVQHIAISQELAELLRTVGDLERVVGRIALRRAHLHDYVHIKHAIMCLPQIGHHLSQLPPSKLLARIHEYTQEQQELLNLLTSALNDDQTKEWIIKNGFNHELDTMRETLTHTHERILALERAQQERTGISSLKIRYNNVQGYYIEITKPNLPLVPPDYERQQTLANVERFNMPELREIEQQLLRARTHINILELHVYDDIKQTVENALPQLRAMAHALAMLDALLGFAFAAYDNNYCCPEIGSETATPRTLIITNGMHPVVSRNLGANFIANSCTMHEHERLWIITGPNMGGKSTYLRQVALISLMAHCGSFVPAQSAQIPIFDRIFTRIGAGDNVAHGKSTFLVEMEETAAICTQATTKSLVILDEVGRGTSTYDGMAIAHAVIEYLHQHVGALCLFATHYHELTSLERLPGIVNYHTACAQKDGRILFLHTIIRGTAPGSFGIHVARLANVPETIIERAQELLHQLPLQNNPAAPTLQPPAPAPVTIQPVHACPTCHQFQKILASINPDELSPRQAHELMYELCKRCQAHNEQ